MNKYVLSIEKFDQFKQYVDLLPQEQQITLLFHTYMPLIDSNSIEFRPLIIAEYRYLVDIFVRFAVEYLDTAARLYDSCPSLESVLKTCGDNLDNLWHYPGLKHEIECYMKENKYGK